MPVRSAGILTRRKRVLRTSSSTRMNNTPLLFLRNHLVRFLTVSGFDGRNVPNRNGCHHQESLARSSDIDRLLLGAVQIVVKFGPESLCSCYLHPVLNHIWSKDNNSFIKSVHFYKFVYSVFCVLKCLRIEYLCRSVHRALNFSLSDADRLSPLPFFLKFAPLT